MASAKSKKILFNNLVHLLQQSDAISIPLGQDINKSKILEQIEIALAGHAVVLQLLMAQLQNEIVLDEDQAKQDALFRQVFEEEQRRFQGGQLGKGGIIKEFGMKPPPAPEDDDIGEEFENGM